MFADALSLLSAEPLLLAGLLFAATFVAEDAATVAAGVAAAQLGADPALPLASVILGTAAGDLALYGLGRWGAQTSHGQKLGHRADVQRAQRLVAHRNAALVVAARFAPGMRLPIFLASGLAAVPFRPFALLIALSTPLWTGLLFEAARRFGEAGTGQLLAFAAPIGLTSLAAILFIRRTKVRPASPA